MNNIKLSLVYGIFGLIINYLVLVYGLPYIFPKVYKYKASADKLKINKVSIPLTIGSCNFDSSKIEINTSNPDKSGYVHLPKSNNLKGGAQFSYSMWLDMKSNTPMKVSDNIIFLKGSLRKGFVTPQTSAQSDILTKCPMVKFVPKSTDIIFPELEISFNTLKHPDNSIFLDEEIFTMIQSSIGNPRWFLLSITFQDYFDFTDSEMGIQIQCFINDHLVKTQTIKNDSIRINNGNFFLTPNNDDDEGDPDSFYADLTYHNFALDVIDIQKIYENGVSNSAGCITAKKTSNDAQEKYQALGQYNYLNQI